MDYSKMTLKEKVLMTFVVTIREINKHGGPETFFEKYPVGAMYFYVANCRSLVPVCVVRLCIDVLLRQSEKCLCVRTKERFTDSNKDTVCVPDVIQGEKILLIPLESCLECR